MHGEATLAWKGAGARVAAPVRRTAYLMDRSPLEAEESDEDCPDGPAQRGTARGRASVWEDARVSHCPACRA
eukprot:5161778-Lingulodinium_polyedra.AAC.1